MRSTIQLAIELNHSRNLPEPDAERIAEQLARFLAEQLNDDPLASATVRVRSAMIAGLVEMTVQAIS